MAAQANNLRARFVDGSLFARGRFATSLALALTTALAICVVHVASAPASVGGERASRAAAKSQLQAGISRGGSGGPAAGGRHGRGGGKGKGGPGGGKGGHGGKGGPGGKGGKGKGKGKGGPPSAGDEPAPADTVEAPAEAEPQASPPDASEGGSGGGGKGKGKGHGKGHGKGGGHGNGGGHGKGGPGGGKGKGKGKGNGKGKGGNGGGQQSPQSNGGSSEGKPQTPAAGGNPPQNGPGNSPSTETNAPADSNGSGAPGKPDKKSKTDAKRKRRSESGSPRARRDAAKRDSAESPSATNGDGTGRNIWPTNGGGDFGAAGSNGVLGAAAVAGANPTGNDSADDSSGSRDGGGKGDDALSEREANATDLRRKAAVSRAVDHVPLGFRLLLLLLMFAVAVLSVVSLRERRRAQSVARVAQLDYLTGLANREGFDRMLGQEWRRAVRYGRPLGLVFVDLDHFKAYNDTHGHLAGDRLLREVAAAISSTARGSDYTARLGGDEFVVLCPESGEEGLAKLAERLKREVEPLDVSLSVGHALQIPDDVGPEDLVARADAAMYRAKGAGRSKVTAGNPMLRSLRGGRS